MHISHAVRTSTLCLLLIAGMMATAAAEEKVSTTGQVKRVDKKTEERGRYIIKIVPYRWLCRGGRKDTGKRLAQGRYRRMARPMRHNLREQSSTLYAESLGGPVDPGLAHSRVSPPDAMVRPARDDRARPTGYPSVH
jgi:hypothetical protein